jgi:hypothetical protein
MNETKTTSSVFDVQLDTEDQNLQVYFESLGLAPQVIDGQLCLSKADILRLCRMVNTKKAAEFEKWIRRHHP